MGDAGRRGARATCTAALKLLRPKAVIGVGVCYGMNKNKQELGDVLVSEKLGLIGNTRLNRDDKRVLKSQSIPECDTRLINLFSSVPRWNGIIPGWNGKVPRWIGCEDRKPTVHSGLIISAPELIDNKEYKEELKGWFPTAIGGEMEGKGKKRACGNNV